MKKLILFLLPFAGFSQTINLLDKPETKFHLWHSDKFEKWTFENGILGTSGGNSDLVTNEQFGDFVLEFEYKVQPGGNSGIIYKSIEDKNDKALFSTYASGPEYQLIDDEGYPQQLQEAQKTGANYDIHEPLVKGKSKPAGEWNTGKIEVKNDRIRHWLNGTLVADYRYGTPEWQQAVAKSKFAEWPYAKAHKMGHIALQDHGDKVWFRKLTIRKL